MKKTIFILSLLMLSFTLFAASEPIVSNGNSPQNNNQQAVDSLLKILKDPKQRESFIKTLETSQSNQSLQPSIIDPVEQISNLDTQVINTLKEADINIVYRKIYLYIAYNYDILKKEVFRVEVNYKSLLYFNLIFAVFAFVSYLIELLCGRIFYNKHSYVRDRAHLAPEGSLINRYYTFITINMKLVLPVFIPFMLSVGVLSLFLHISFIVTIIKLLSIFLLLRLGLTLIYLIFYKVDRKSLILLKIWLLILVYTSFILSYVQCLLLIGKESILSKLVISLAVIVIPLIASRAVYLCAIVVKKSKAKSHKSYEIFVFRLKRYVSTIIFIGTSGLLSVIVILIYYSNKNLLVDIVKFLIIAAIIYAIQKLIRSFVKEYIVHKLENDLDLLRHSPEVQEDYQPFDLNIFWHFFSYVYVTIFVVIYCIAIDRSFDLDLMRFLKSLLDIKIVNIAISMFIGVFILFIIALILVVSLQHYVVKLAKQSDYKTVRKLLTVFSLCKRLYLIVMGFVIFVIFLSSLGLSVSTFLASTGVVTLLVGVGMKDVFQSFFNTIIFLMEDSLALNDTVEINGVQGVVEHISIVYIKLRDSEGKLNMIPFKTVESITNYSKDYSYALITLRVLYNENNEDIEKILQQSAIEVKNMPEFNSIILDSLEIVGIVGLDNGTMDIRCRIKTLPGKQFGVKVALLQRIRTNFINNNIELPHYSNISFSNK